LAENSYIEFEQYKAYLFCKITKAVMTHFSRHWFFVNMPFSKEYKILVKNLFELKVYNATRVSFSKG